MDTIKSSVATITSATGLRFVARIIRAGDRYGREGCLTWNDPRPAVEFYDTRYPHTEFGQFTGGRFYVHTLLDTVSDLQGLILHGGVPDWQIDGPAMAVIRKWLRNEIGNAL